MHLLKNSVELFARPAPNSWHFYKVSIFTLTYCRCLFLACSVWPRILAMPDWRDMEECQSRRPNRTWTSIAAKMGIQPMNLETFENNLPPETQGYKFLSYAWAANRLTVNVICPCSSDKYLFCHHVIFSPKCCSKYSKHIRAEFPKKDGWKLTYHVVPLGVLQQERLGTNQTWVTVAIEREQLEPRALKPTRFILSPSEIVQPEAPLFAARVLPPAHLPQVASLLLNVVHFCLLCRAL